MKTQKREINPAITLQREKHQAIVKSLKDQINSAKDNIKNLENENRELRNKVVKLQAQHLARTTVPSKMPQ